MFPSLATPMEWDPILIHIIFIEKHMQLEMRILQQALYMLLELCNKMYTLITSYTCPQGSAAIKVQFLLAGTVRDL